jgi:hypothetical protein
MRVISVYEDHAGFLDDIEMFEKRHAFGDECVRHRAHVAPGQLAVGEEHSRPVEYGTGR